MIASSLKETTMLTTKRMLALTTTVALSLALLTPAPSLAQEQAKPAIAAMLEVGPEAQLLASRAGDWDATITIWPAPGAEPLVWTDVTAHREMVGGFLQEVLFQDGPEAFKRLSYLHYNRVEGRWQYVSMDTRFPAGIMPATGEASNTPDRIVLEFEPIAFPGWGTDVDGWMLRSNLEVTGLGTDHEVARQHWVRADGTGTRWLAVEFDYKRR